MSINYFCQNACVCIDDMVDRSDLVLCYIQHKNGGAYKTIKYAEEQGKTILNLAAEY